MKGRVINSRLRAIRLGLENGASLIGRFSSEEGQTALLMPPKREIRRRDKERMVFVKAFINQVFFAVFVTLASIQVLQNWQLGRTWDVSILLFFFKGRVNNEP